MYSQMPGFYARELGQRLGDRHPMAGAVVALIAEQGDMPFDLIDELLQERVLSGQVLVERLEKPLVVPVFTELMTNRLGRTQLLLVAVGNADVIQRFSERRF